MSHLHRPLTRRTLLKSGAGAASLATFMPRWRALASARLQETPVRGGSLIIGTAQQIQTLDPHKGGLRNNRNSWVGLFSFLTRYDDDGVPGPALAESWETAADGLSWTFKLRPGVQFHNGRELVADDVKFSIERVMNPDTAAPLLRNIGPVTAVDVVDPLTVTFTLSQPYGMLAAGLVPIAIVAPENVADLETKPIGTGPFKLKEYVVGQNLDLEKFAEHWEAGEDGQPLPYVDAVSIRTLTDTNALFTALSTGTVHGFWQMPDQIQVQAEGVQEIQLVPSKFKTTYDEYFFQADAAPFNDKNVRQALLFALDKQAINEAGYFGRADPRLNNNVIQPGSWAEDTAIPEIPRDPQKAKELFDAAGVTTLKFLGYTETPQFRPISQVMERNLNEIGIELELEFTDLTTWFSRIKLGNMSEPWGNGDDGNAFTVNISVNPPDPGIPLASWGCKTHFGSHYCNDALKSAALEGAQSADIETRKAAYVTYQQIWQEDIPSIITCARAFTHAALTTVHGLYDDDGALNYRAVWIERE